MHSFHFVHSCIGSLCLLLDHLPFLGSAALTCLYVSEVGCPPLLPRATNHHQNEKREGGGIRETHRSYMPPFDVASGSFRMALESTHHWQVPTCPFGSSPPPSPPRSFHNSRSLSPTEGITTVWMHTRRVLRHCTSPLVDATRVATVLRTNVAIERQTRHGQSIPNLSWKLEQRCRFESETRKKRRVLEDALRPHLNGGCA